MEQDKINDIVVHFIEGVATEKEIRLLEEWISLDVRHGEMLDRLQDRHEMAKQYARWKAIDVESSKLRMKKMLRPRSRKYFYASGIAAVLVLAFMLIYPTFFSFHEKTATAPAPDYIGAIVPGQPMATLTQSDGASVDLKNENFIVKSHPKPVTEDVSLQNTRAELEEIACNVITVPRGGEFHIVLEDSTEVWLNADSYLEYPESFSDENRRVKVSGEAYFKVHPEKNRPFYVYTSGQVVRVYGTEFGVNAYPEDNNVYTTLVEGKVGIFPEEMQSSMLFLSPDHQAVFSKSEENITVEPVNSRITTSWKDGMFVFEDQTLKQIMVQLSRWYDFEYEFADETVEQIQFKGRIHRYSKFADLLEILSKAGGVRFSSKDDRIMISKLR